MTDLEKKIEKLLKEQDKYIGWQKDATKAILTLFKERAAAWREEMAKKVEELRPSNEKGYTVSFHNARTMAAALLRSKKDV